MKFDKNSIADIEAKIADKNKPLISEEEVESYGDKASIISIVEKIAKYNLSLKRKLTFINEEISKSITFTMDNFIVIGAYTGAGKCEKINTPILMADGSIKMIQNIVTGDKVMGPDSTPRTVLETHAGIDQMYDIIPTKGEAFTVNSKHLLSLRLTTKRKILKGFEKNDIVNISVEDYINKPSYFKNSFKGYRAEAIEFEEKEITLDPYYLGNWLGDGTSTNANITTPDKEVVNNLESYSQKLNMNIKSWNKINKNGEENKARTYSITGDGSIGGNYLLNELRNLNLIENKHVPINYKINSKKIRLELLAGLMDSDGSLSNNGFDYITKDIQLAKDILFLCRSLGLAAYMKECKKSCPTSKGIFTGTYFRISISGNTDIIPTRIKRKQAQKRKQIKDVLSFGFEIKKANIGQYYGFSLDSDSLYLHEDFTVMHNSSVAANISYPLWKQGQNVLGLANEESDCDVVFRVACIELGLSYNDYKNGKMSAENQLLIIKMIPEITKHIKIFDNNYKNGLTGTLEGVISFLEAIKNRDDYSCVLIDYYQNVKRSIDHPEWDLRKILVTLQVYIKNYIKHTSFPVVMFAQLHSVGKRPAKEMDSRIKEAPSVEEAATLTIEVVPDREARCSDFIIHKSRFGIAGFRMTLGFDKGKFVNYTEDFKRKVNTAKNALMEEELQRRREKQMTDVLVAANIEEMEEK